MESIKKYWLWGIFISILSIFAMSHNASAVELSINLNNYENIRHSDNIYIGCRINGNSLSAQAYTCNSDSVISGASYLQEIRFYGDYHWQNNGGVKKGDLIEWYLIVFTNQNYTVNGMVRGPQYVSTYSYLDTISFEEVADTSFYQAYSSTCSYDSSSMNCYTSDGYKIYKVYHIIQRVNTDLTERWTYGLNITGSYHIFEWYESIAGIVRFKMVNFNQYRFVGSEENKEQEEKTQEAVDDSQAAGGSSSQDAQTGTTGLLNAITGAVNVISSASPTNCKINGNMGNLDMGQLDLCANPAPAFVQTIGSLILILICVPLAISLFNRFIAIFRSFQS